MTRTPLFLTLFAVAALAGCDKSSHTIVAGPQEDTVNKAAVANVELPPSILSSKSYRCGDNSIVYVDWLSDKKSANLRTERTGTPTNVSAAAPGQPLTGGGYTVAGGFNGSSIKLTRPGKGEQSCTA